VTFFSKLRSEMVAASTETWKLLWEPWTGANVTVVFNRRSEPISTG
jgi:hypothetical protein